jgi:hypothetical protein
VIAGEAGEGVKSDLVAGHDLARFSNAFFVIVDQDRKRPEDGMIWRQLTPAPGQLRDHVRMNFEIPGHGGDPLLAIKQLTERIEPIDRVDWNAFGGRFARPLGRYRLPQVHFYRPMPKPGRLGFDCYSENPKKSRKLRRPQGQEMPRSGHHFCRRPTEQ